MRHAKASFVSGPQTVALVVFALVACGKKVATISAGPVPGTSEVQLAMPTGRAIAFDVYIEKYKHEGMNDLRLQVSLLRAGKVVASTECSGSALRGRSGSGCQSTNHNACPITAPEGGADAVRVETRFANPAPASVEGVEFRVREK